MPELQTDAQSARIAFLFELLDHVRSVGGMPIPYFPHKPDIDPDDWGNGGSGGDGNHGDDKGLDFSVFNYGYGSNATSIFGASVKDNPSENSTDLLGNIDSVIE